MKEGIKALARGLATLVILPQLASFYVRASLMGRDRAFEGSMQALAFVPGLLGQYVRRAFVSCVIEHCAPTAVIRFGVLMSKTACRLDDHAYIGPCCHLGHVHVERDVMLAAGVHVPSGPRGHGMDPSLPMREQEGTLRRVRIGAGSWIGANAIVLADVGRDTIVGAGAVVAKPLPDRVIAAGVPARVVRSRDESDAVSV